MSVFSKLKAIADAIRAKTGKTAPLNLDQMAEGVAEVYEAGKKSQYDEFWDAYQDYGKRSVYEFAFAGKGWTNETFKPKYDLILDGGVYCTQMFHSSLITDLIGILEAQNIRLDTYGCKNVGQMFQSSLIPIIPPIDFTTATGATNYAFGSSSIITIQKLKVSESTNFMQYAFHNATSLEEIDIEGTIGTGTLNFQWSKKLSKASITGIFEHFSTTASLSATFSKQAVNTAFETSPGAGDGSTSPEWLALLGTRPNCTISLI